MSETGFIEVGGKQYGVIKTGRAQAAQALEFTRWLTKYGVRAFRAIQADSTSDESGSGIEVISKLAEGLDTDAVIDLFIVLVGCPREDAELYFDIGILIDTAIQVYEGQPSLKRLIDRFFSTPISETNSEDPSTKSEQPTD